MAWRAPIRSVRPGDRAIRLLLLLVAVFGVAGCHRSGESAPGAKVPPAARAYGQLPGLESTPNVKLQDELARIVEERATPQWLDRGEIAQAENAAAALVDLFDGKDVAKLRDQTDQLMPAGRFQYNPIQLERVIHFRKQHEAQRLAAAEALKRPRCRLPILFEAGFAADLSTVDAVWVCARLEMFRGAEALSNGSLGEATKCFGRVLRWAGHLASEPHLTVRLEGAFLRTEALNLLQSIANHKEVGKKELAQAQRLLSAQLADWPDDGRAWIGDRALGMVLYEAVRDGKLTKQLAPEELERFKKEGIASDLDEAARRHVDSDELYYLETMRRVIASCRRPYYARKQVFAAIRDDLHERQDGTDFPLVAGRLLLAGIEKGHVIQARDRANCEAWTLATALATGVPPPAEGVNPLSGKPYRVVRQDGLVTVYDVGSGEGEDNPPVIVPDFSAGGG